MAVREYLIANYPGGPCVAAVYLLVCIEILQT